MRAVRREPDPGTGDERGHRRGDEDLVCVRERGDARADVNGQPADPGGQQLDLAGVQAGAYGETERVGRVPDPARAVDRPGRPVEGREDSVARELDELAAEALDVRADELVVRLADALPGRVTQRRHALGGADDVGEQDGREHAVGRAGSANARDELLDLVEERAPAASSKRAPRRSV